MAANIYNLSSLVGQGVVASLTADSVLLETCGKDYNKDFVQAKYAPGLSLTINKGPQFSVTSGQIADVQAVEFDNTSVTVVQYNEAISLGSLEQSYDLTKDYDMMRLGKDMGRRMLREAERIGFQTIATYAGNFVGSPGAEPGALRLLGKANQFMTDGLAPNEDRYCMLTPGAEVELADAMKNLTNPGAEISNIYLRGKLKRWSNLMIASTPSVYRPTLGSCTNATPLTNGASVDGASTLDINGLSAATATVKKGTHFTIGVAGTSTAVYAVDPETKAVLPYLKMFVVTADATGVSSEIAALAISPTIRGTASQHQNVSQLPPNDAEITFQLGNVASGQTYGSSVMYQKEAVQLIGLDLPAAHTKGTHTFADYNGLQIRTGVGAWNPINDTEILRVDAAFAFVITRPGHCSVIQGA
jgi:hypothetical protein